MHNNTSKKELSPLCTFLMRVLLLLSYTSAAHCLELLDATLWPAISQAQSSTAGQAVSVLRRKNIATPSTTALDTRTLHTRVQAFHSLPLRRTGVPSWRKLVEGLGSLGIRAAIRELCYVYYQLTRSTPHDIPSQRSTAMHDLIVQRVSELTRMLITPTFLMRVLWLLYTSAANFLELVDATLWPAWKAAVMCLDQHIFGTIIIIVAAVTGTPHFRQSRRSVPFPVVKKELKARVARRGSDVDSDVSTLSERETQAAVNTTVAGLLALMHT
ncbi:hypothetical protein B0H65DRAFT_583338 [Neurospora tetraspora]|uniref:Uncharacterized protein n=1 Tax=Neurospora tetraspora TaxID=94610 RepID=A0AAE0J144_9PEZI|nr:hypothetical protein B0H65DRAFT_583338 [Neurospora tetraspora]